MLQHYLKSGKRIKPQHNNIITIGRIGAPYGVKGWLKLHSFTDPLDNILEYTWLVQHQGSWQELEVVAAKPYRDGFIALFANYQDRDLAAKLTNADIGVVRTDLAEPSDNEYYWCDLIGLEVYDSTGKKLGVVQRLFATKVDDMLVFKGEHEYCVPFLLDKTILRVDLANKQIIISDLCGLVS